MEQSREPVPRDHFSEQRWSDFVRGLADDAHHHEIQSHLDSGCQLCCAIERQLRSVAKLGASDRALDIPAEAVARARGLFDPAHSSAAVASTSTKWMDSLTPILAELVSSVRADWQLAGVRSSSAGVSGDRMLFRAGDYSVDLELEPPLDHEAGEIIGQIANERNADDTLEGIPVQMVVSGRILGETSTNSFGEFLMDYPAKKRVSLRFALKDRGQRIDLSLALGNN